MTGGPQKLSVVIPAYNEARTLGALLERIAEVDTEAVGFYTEIIVVDDGSVDETAAIAEGVAGVKVLRQANAGKGAAVQRGVQEATGRYVLVQDADLEYDPADYVPMLRALAQRPRAAIYGSRVRGTVRRRGARRLLVGKHEDQGVGPWAAGVILSGCTLALYGRLITDTLTAYKIYPLDVLRRFTVKTRGFETDHELTAKLIKAGVEIVEVPIAYLPRSREEGKKIRARDGVRAVWTLARFRVAD